MRPFRLRHPARPDRPLLRRGRRHGAARRGFEPNYNVAPTTTSTSSAPTAHVRRLERLPLGAGAVLGQGPVGRQPDDQRPGRVDRREERLQAGLREASLHHPGRRLLRVDGGRPARRRSSRCTSSASTASRSPSPGCGRSWRSKDASPDDAAARRAPSSPARPTTRWRRDPRPDAGDPAAVGLGRPGSIPTIDDLDLLGELLVPAPSSLLTLHPVGTEVNNVRNNDPHLVDAVDPATPADDAGHAAARRDRSLTATFRRRVDNVILRWQGRLDSDQADRLAPWVVAVALFLVLNAARAGPGPVARRRPPTWPPTRRRRGRSATGSSPTSPSPPGRTCSPRRARSSSTRWPGSRTTCRRCRCCSPCSRPRWPWPSSRSGGSAGGWPPCAPAPR